MGIFNLFFENDNTKEIDESPVDTDMDYDKITREYEALMKENEQLDKRFKEINSYWY